MLSIQSDLTVNVAFTGRHCFSFFHFSICNSFGPFGWDALQLILEIVFKLLFTTIWPVLFYWNLIRHPFSWTISQFWFAALHWIWLGTYDFVPMPCFYTETNEWWKACAKQWALLWSVTSSSRIHWNLITPLKLSSQPNLAKSTNPSQNTLCLCLLVLPERGPKKTWQTDFSVKNFNGFLEKPSGVIARYTAGFKLGLKLKLCCLTTEL